MNVKWNPVQMAMLLAGFLSSGTGAYAGDTVVASAQVTGLPAVGTAGGASGAASAASPVEALAPAAPSTSVDTAASAEPATSAAAYAAYAAYAAKAPPSVSGHYVSGIAGQYGLLLGSSANIESLVAGLRNGTPITLSGDDESGHSATFASPAGRMGYGDITQTLSLVAKQLVLAGLERPTPEQLQAVLTGGEVFGGSGDSVTLAGILRLRSQGMGWVKIAQAIGVQPGFGKASAGAQAGNGLLPGRGALGLQSLGTGQELALAVGW